MCREHPMEHILQDSHLLVVQTPHEVKIVCFVTWMPLTLFPVEWSSGWESENGNQEPNQVL